jgi:hypothetical protein
MRMRNSIQTVLASAVLVTGESGIEALTVLLLALRLPTITRFTARDLQLLKGGITP